MKSIGFNRSNYDSCVYLNGKRGSDQILLLLYVDNMLVIGKNLNEIKDLKLKLGG